MKTRIASAFLAAAFAFTPALAGAQGPAAPQGVTDGELLRWVYNAPFPHDCPYAEQFVRDLRNNPVGDPATMHKGMRLFTDCEHSPYGIGHIDLRNLGIYATSVAALLAARGEAPPVALQDARLAKEGAAQIVAFRLDLWFPTEPPDPSIFRTDAARVERDADALILRLAPQVR